jgi:peptide/nickel transport system substrate-binding protein
LREFAGGARRKSTSPKGETGMDRETRRLVDEYRHSEAGVIENNLIDELVAGDVDRQEFLRRASVFGLGAGTMGLLLRYVGEAEPAFGATTGEAQKRGGTLRVGAAAVGSSFEPILLREAGTLSFAGIMGEFLTFSNAALQLKPWLATSWKSNANATVWTFQLRRGVKFHNGKTMTADDVVASFRQYMAAPTSQLFSAIPKTLLAPEGVVKTGQYTVQFRLKEPNGAFPQLVSQTSYQAIIQPAAIANKPGTWVGSGMIGTGAFRFKSGTPGRRAELVRFPAYWGGSPPLDGVVFTWYEGTAPQVLALRAGQIDLSVQLSAQEAAPFRNNSRYKVYTIPSASHRMFGLRTDREPFKDPRVRRAVALTLNRPDLIRRILLGAGTLGNDSPFWSKYPSTDRSIKQRKQDLALARALLKAAGQSNLKFTVTTWNGIDLPDYAQAIQAAGRQAGMDIDLEVMSSDDYYGGGADYYATTPWINRPATITEYGARGVPNLFLTAAYMSDGIWNASHYKNPAFDAAARSYLAAADIKAQRTATKRMAGLLLRDTPVITSYFISYVTASSAKVRNYIPDAISHVRIAKTSLA